MATGMLGPEWSVYGVMFWGCVTYDGVGTLEAVEGNINSEKYIEVLDTHLWPVVVKNFSTWRW